MTDQDRGLYSKYHVRKADTGEVVNGCIVLRPDRDRAARSALRIYSTVISASHPQFAQELGNYLDAIEAAQKQDSHGIRLYESWGESAGDFAGWTEQAAGDPCPRCTTPLEKRTYPTYDEDGQEVDVVACETCNLLWFERQTA